jgi:DNA-binding XRE family transcriptional regulator
MSFRAEEVAAFELDARWVMALNHPVRVRILELALQVEIISASELARALDVKLGVVSYHVRMLHRAKLLLLAGTTPIRGSVRYSYLLADPVGTARALAYGSELARLTSPADAERERRDRLLRRRLGAGVAEFREAAGISRAELGTRVGISTSTLALIESGDVDPVWTLLCRIARELDTRAGDLCNRADDLAA